MSIQFSAAVRSARLDAIETATGASAKLLIYSGAKPSDCAQADPAGLLATIALPSDWMNAASAGQKTLLGTWSVAASGTGTAASFRIKDSGLTTCHVQGTVGMGTGDLSLDNTSIATGQTVQVTTFALTDGNS